MENKKVVYEREEVKKGARRGPGGRREVVGRGLRVNFANFVIFGDLW